MTTAATDLQNRLEEVGETLTSGDADRIGDLYTREGQLMPPGSEFVTGREAVAEFWQGVSESGIDTIDIETLEVDDHGETASRVGRATLADGEGTPVDRVKFVELWRREDGDWRIHRDIWNSNAEE